MTKLRALLGAVGLALTLALSACGGGQYCDDLTSSEADLLADDDCGGGQGNWGDDDEDDD